MCAHSATGPLVVDHTLTSVSCSHGRVRAASAQPPHRSTTVLPPTVTATAAPSSPRPRKFSSNALRTAVKRASTGGVTLRPRESNHTSTTSPGRVSPGTRAVVVRVPSPGSVQRTVAR
ncbi:hypothetical protein SVIOM74S_05897 [Streptomyces violarus]